ncbi:MAG: D-tyrosyl-tRNA(Tyr) deacylase [gamma proteobacterium symbiont of Ctena orbiculata]|uniref:D-aminoacyl-tRNA deacylase n=1 Tax=Candidatus Thiodiazotropha taylori TaxID=2792791 RepID=A0A944M9S7_9GAMM|nr:D-tyrosyl-tRNA(Tyr) deacylase [Candidatus Thiodiazotropha taylori]PUB81939.1 MAG: D-tyrosyl-tRNA(Tyr) deacylase [gamma proteobacterium symbiont of Ctena orbiculata]MBT2987968.1 D-tyrosyl-tRNA(Tyr) deacylase [Candidatus Thiodiazotropha taylori]MBT2997613.1 D-tyrosyl-tRNA(Tyr) deacylase [Candidatus Thiodiazotropha taylori]MBT3001966.1 D-tyrosyl-tRNA(Tyr) deacylase [Candidatus Thiodiazotropha taylori]
MIGLLQRVNEASVHIDGACVAAIERGLAVLVGVERDDNERRADRLLERVLGYRVFSDANGRMNLSLGEIEGGLLLVPQFTLAADTGKGMRPGFSSAAEPELGKALFNYLKERAEAQYHPVACGVFGADMQLALVNDGPVTFWLES